MLNKQILTAFLVTYYEDIFSGINLKRYCGFLLLKISKILLQNIPNFLYQSRNWNDSKPTTIHKIFQTNSSFHVK